MKQYVVQTFTRGGRSVVELFGTLEMAKLHAILNPNSLVFRMDQVARIEDGYVYLHIGNSDPVYPERD